MDSTQTQPQPKQGKPVTALVLGIVGMIAWLIPIIGLPVQITGLVFGIKALKSPKRGMAIAAIVLCIIGLVLTIINAAIGAYLGATGQIPALNDMTNK